jgi:hypothetical protein
VRRRRDGSGEAGDGTARDGQYVQTLEGMTGAAAPWDVIVCGGVCCLVLGASASCER